MITFTALFPFCGLGAGARGFLDAHVELLGQRARFVSLGGIDIDAEACRDFARLTGSPALQADVATMTPQDLRRFAGDRCPDVIFTSPPCKGFSGLLSKKAARKEKYRALNRLVIQWLDLVLTAWSERPRLILLENVPRIASRGKGLLRRVRSKLHREGYVFTAGTHDCGELGGLAQHRVRYLLVARHPDRCPPLLYQPPRRRVRGCGEVLGALPLPGTLQAEAAGPLHRLPRLSWLNVVRLALIPAGGDWRDLPGVLEAGQQRREIHKRHEVVAWDEATGTVCGSHGSNGVGAVADPRPTWHRGVYGVRRWDDASGTVTGEAHASTGAFSVADPRLSCAPRGGAYGVLSWHEPSPSVIGHEHVDRARGAVADPRLSDRPARHRNKYRVMRWAHPSGAVIGATRPGSGAPAVSDPRIVVPGPGTYKGKYAVMRWDEPSRTVIGGPSNGADFVADPRPGGAFDHGWRVLRWDEASYTVAGKTSPGCGAYQVADPRVLLEDAEVYDADELLGLWDGDPRRPPPFLPVIISPDGCWHRPLTTLELAVLQGLPAELDGAPLELAGRAVSRWRERIGNAVPVGAAEAIASQMLVALTETALGEFSLQTGPVWVEPNREATWDAS